MREDAFARAYRQARQAALSHTVGALQQATAEALSALREALTCDSPGVRVRAAATILTVAFKGAEVLDLAERLEAVERTLKERRP